jgi:hypothetical protein
VADALQLFAAAPMHACIVLPLAIAMWNPARTPPMPIRSATRCTHKYKSCACRGHWPLSNAYRHVPHNIATASLFAGLQGHHLNQQSAAPAVVPVEEGHRDAARAAMIAALMAQPELVCDERLSDLDHADEVAEFYSVAEVCHCSRTQRWVGGCVVGGGGEWVAAFSIVPLSHVAISRDTHLRAVASTWFVAVFLCTRPLGRRGTHCSPPPRSHSHSRSRQRTDSPAHVARPEFDSVL